MIDMQRALLCVALVVTVVEARPRQGVFVPTAPPEVLYAEALVVPQKFRDMMQAPAKAEEDLKEHPDLTEAMLDEQKADPDGTPLGTPLGLLQGATSARTGTARMLANMGTVERMLSKELAGHPEIKTEELRDLRQAEDLTLAAGKLMPHKHAAMKHAAFMQQKTESKAVSAASLKAEARSELNNYGHAMKKLSEADRQTAQKLGKARDTVEEALEAAGASVKLENEVDAALSKAERYGRRIVSHESHEAVDALKKASTMN